MNFVDFQKNCFAASPGGSFLQESCPPVPRKELLNMLLQVVCGRRALVYRQPYRVLAGGARPLGVGPYCAGHASPLINAAHV